MNSYHSYHSSIIPHSTYLIKYVALDCLKFERDFIFRDNIVNILIVCISKTNLFIERVDEFLFIQGFIHIKKPISSIEV